MNPIRLLLIGPKTLTGGVSVHTQCLAAQLKKEEEVSLLSYNTIEEGDGTIMKLLRKTLLLYSRALRWRDRYDIIHIQTSGELFGFLDAITATIVSRQLGKRLVITFHHSNSEEFFNGHERLVTSVFNRSDRLILVSKKQRDALISLKRNRCQPEVIPNGYSEEEFHPIPMEVARSKLNIPQDKKVLLAIGSLEEYKGHRYLVQAMKKVLETHPNVVLYILGEGSLKNELRALSRELGIERHVILAGGGKPREEIPLWMNACDVFVLPSIAEAFSIVQIEAMACGKPVVATRNGGIPEIMIDERLGILVEAKDPNALADSILRAFDREWNRVPILSFISYYTWEKITKRTLEVYRSMISH